MWWACVARDRWLCLGFGTPMRIIHSNNDVAVILPEDVAYELQDIPASIKRDYIPREIDVLSQYYVLLLKLSLALGRALDKSNVTKEAVPTIADVEILEGVFDRLYHESKELGRDRSFKSSMLVKLAAYHFDICYT
jgi:hypothetical protein